MHIIIFQHNYRGRNLATINTKTRDVTVGNCETCNLKDSFIDLSPKETLLERISSVT